MAEKDDDQGITWHGKKPSPEHPPGGAPEPQPAPTQATPATPTTPTGPDQSGITWHGRGGPAATTAQPTQQPAATQQSRQPPGQTSGPTLQQVPIRTEDMPDPAAAVAHGLIGVPVEAGRLVNQYGAKPLGWDLSNLVPGSMQRGWDVLTQRAQKGGGTEIGEAVGSGLPFAGAGKIAEGLPWAGRVLTRSVIPSILQPTTGPIDATTKAFQTILGTGVGEGMQAISWLARTPLGRWALDQMRSKASADREAQAAARDQLQRTVAGRSAQLGETAAKTAARDTEEQARQRAYSAARSDYERQASEAATVEARNRARQQVIDRLNQRGELDYAGRRAQAAADEVRRLDTPRQATQSLLNDARGLIGLRPLEYNLSREAAPQALREVGGELDRIYRSMNFDPNQGGWLRTAQRVQQDIRNRLRQDPRAQALWDQVFQDKAFMPGLRAEAGVQPPARGVGPGTVRSPTGQNFAQRSLPTGDVQGPLGTRSGPMSGDQLARMMSVLTKAQQRFGLEAQRGGGALYRDMAEGLSSMRQSMEAQLDARFPQLAEQRALANQAYFLTSRVMDAVDVHGVATPEQLLAAFKSAEGDTRFGTDQRYADIKDRLEQQHQAFTAKPDKPEPFTAQKSPDEPVPRVGKEPTPPEPVPDIQPVPLRVPKSTRVATPQTRVDPRLPPAAEHLAGEAGRMASHATGIPLLGAAARGAARYGKPLVTPPLRGIRDVTRTAATPASILASRGTAAVAAQEQQEQERARRRREERQRRMRQGGQ